MKEYDQLRDQVILRDNYTCIRCKSTSKKLEVHHIIARQKGGNQYTNSSS